MSKDPIEALAQSIIHKHRNDLPDLSQVVVLINNPNRISALRDSLLNATNEVGVAGLIGPNVLSLRDYVTTQYAPKLSIIDDHARELMLYRALQQHQGLFGDLSTWFLIENLLTLFDELSANTLQLPNTESDFVYQLANAYGINHPLPQPLSREAKIVYTLWNAYHQELQANNLTDKETAYQQGLNNLINTPDNNDYYLAGYYRLLPLELRWLQSLDQNKQLQLFLHGNPELGLYNQTSLSNSLVEIFQPSITLDDNHYAAFLATVFPGSQENGAKSLKQRAKSFCETHPEPDIKHRLHFSKFPSAENEAEAVALQLALWRQAGKQDLAIITEDRRLARRIRALLERYGLGVNDYTGWALSTTSTAAAVDSWLNCLEQDFAYQPLLDILKSPYVLPDWEKETLSKAAFRFEQDIIRHENIQENLNRYRFYIRSRQKRLQWKDNTVSELLDTLEHAAEPLLPLIRSDTTLVDLLSGLELSLQRIGLIQTLQKDEAGQAIIEQLRSMLVESNADNETMSWQEFRRWFARTLENNYFQLERNDGDIALLPLSQSNLERFDAIVIAAADTAHLPLIASPSPLFNQAVRAELGLRTHHQELDASLYHFRRLLESAPTVLITYATNNNGEPQTMSPWLELLNAFHELAYGEDLHDDSLSLMLQTPDITKNSDSIKPKQPSPSLEPRLIPQSYSAYSYQEIINCPYRYYASQCLQLAAPEAIREALQKSDYGEIVHRCLQALHSEVENLPGPFSESFTIDTRDSAIELLNNISDRAFAAELEDNSIHRVWLQRWKRCIPAYIDWQIKQSRHNSVYKTEVFIEIEKQNALPSLRGRIDRIDRSSGGDTIIDYKTGYSAHIDDVLIGESVQLPFYNMLWQHAATTSKYVTLGETIKETTIEENELAAITQLNQQRLNTIHQQLTDECGLTAWGDESVCQYCDFQGICRKQSWAD